MISFFFLRSVWALGASHWNWASKPLCLNYVQIGKKMTMLKEIPLEKELPSGINIMTVL